MNQERTPCVDHDSSRQVALNAEAAPLDDTLRKSAGICVKSFSAIEESHVGDLSSLFSMFPPRQQSLNAEFDYTATLPHGKSMKNTLVASNSPCSTG